jgi:hypothetical protein
MEICILISSLRKLFKNYDKENQHHFLLLICVIGTYSQKLQLNDQEFELKNVIGSVTELNGEKS